MGKLIDVVRIFHIARSFSHRLHPFDTRILAASNVRDVIVTLVLDRTHRIDGPGRGIDIFKVLSRAGLVTHAPNDDAGMVIVGLYHLDHPGHMGIFPFDRMRKGSVTVVIMMAFDISLIHKVDPVFVAEIVPVRSIRVMGVADMIDIGSFHETDVLLHHLTGDSVAHGWLCLVTVNPAEFHGFAVEIEILPGEAELIFRRGSVFDAYFTEADNGREYVKCLSGSVLEFSDKGVTMRRFGGPGFGGRIVQGA